MKKIFQNFKSGKLEILEVPVPEINENEILIKTNFTLISPGTEKMLIDLSKSSLLSKAMKQPDRVKQVISKMQTDGIIPTLETIKIKLDSLLPMGYCNCGEVVRIGKGVTGFKIGERVISNGPHAEFVAVSKNLCSKIPDNVSDESAVYTVMGAIAMQGIRLVKPSFGESVVVIGLGLIGILTAQILSANGCRVVGVDTSVERVRQAKNIGITAVTQEKDLTKNNYIKKIAAQSSVDAVIICANTVSNEPMHQAANLCRKNGRVILVGSTGLNISRDDFFEKEITFQVSCSYGPGRYDENYEVKGNDYPIGYVRWTEKRNFDAILHAMALDQIDVSKLTTDLYEFTEIEKAYKKINNSKNSLGVLLEYNAKNKRNSNPTNEKVIILNKKKRSKKISKISSGFIGAGAYAEKFLIPYFQKNGVLLNYLVSKEGISATRIGKKFNFQYASTSSDEIFKNKLINTVVISTQHNTHSDLVIKSINSSKNVFVEKPLCINKIQLDEIEKAFKNSLKKKKEPFLMIGFNRRFSPHVIKIKELLKSSAEPHSFIYTINSGKIDSSHWTQDLHIGGGRIIGEVCHFIDLLSFLSGSGIKSHKSIKMNSENNDTLSILLEFDNGSVGSINYFSNGNNSYPKEKLEIFSDGKILLLDNFKKLTGFGWHTFRKFVTWQQDKGQENCIKAFVNAIKLRESPPIDINDILNTSKICIEIEDSLNGN